MTGPDRLTERFIKQLHYWSTHAGWRYWPGVRPMGATAFRATMRKSMLELVSPVQHDADIVRLLLDFGEWLAWSEARNSWRGMKNSEVKEHFAKQCGALYLRFPHDGWKTRGGKTVHPREWKSGNVHDT